MEVKEFLEYTQACITTGEIDKAIEKYKEIQTDFRHNSESATLSIIFAIYESEKELKENSFFDGRSSIAELMDCYNQLKLYLRRYDFDVCYDATEFVDFVNLNRISSSAILYVVKTSIIHPIKVLNETAMSLLENEEYILALRVLKAAYKESQDDVTLFNLAQALCCCEKYDSAKKIIDLIGIVSPQVRELRLMIQEKLS